MKLAYSTPWGATNAWINAIFRHPNEELHPSLNTYAPRRRLFADGHVMFSYGDHHPLVRWIPEYKVFTINNDKASQTTSRHLSTVSSLVRQYAPIMGFAAMGDKFGEAKVFNLSFSDGWLPEYQCSNIIKYYDDTIRERATRYHRARKEFGKEMQARMANKWIAERNLFCQTFGHLFPSCGIPDQPQLPEDVQAALVLMKLMEK